LTYHFTLFFFTCFIFERDIFIILVYAITHYIEMLMKREFSFTEPCFHFSYSISSAFFCFSGFHVTPHTTYFPPHTVLRRLRFSASAAAARAGCHTRRRCAAIARYEMRHATPLMIRAAAPLLMSVC
jgi:hypothetical protein